MRFGAGLMALAVAALPSVLAAQTKAPAAPSTAPPTAPAAPVASPPTIVIERVSIDELKKLMEADRVVVLDVRAAESYREAHIPGSLSVPLAELDKHLEKLKSEKKAIVTYCS
jgi:3-mercaptopyruvate sulfurtransferase SseA